MADLRYVEAWKRQSTASRAAAAATGTSAAAAGSSKPQPYNVRLDQPGDGISYAPDALASSHNTAKRLFLPASISLASPASAYDFQAEITARKKERQANFKLGDYDGDDADEDEEEQDFRYQLNAMSIAEPDARSIAAPSVRSVATIPAPRKDSDNASIGSLASLRSTITASNLFAAATAGSSSSNALPRATYSVANRIPPSISGVANAQTPWTAPLRTNAAALDRITLEEREAGQTKDRWEQMNERGNVPVELLAGSPPIGSGRGADAASIFSDTASIRTTAEQLRVETLFVPDPRSWRPLRYVRRTDPRQLLLLTHGLLVRNPATGGLAGGIGVEYCPSSLVSPSSKRIEKNLSHALEKPPDAILLQSTTLTPKRAALRAALAALEYADWYEEGFDQVVVGVAHDWLVRGISSDIWQWKQDDWVITSGAGAELGVAPGERVPDRDLWELLDERVRALEVIDCNVRFWRVSKADLETAKELAIFGATNDKPRPETVRWRKKPRNLDA
ncbi:hypothetical protein OC834_000395 [Tilletia horrida]|nr:hypothetical protein OC834_000395 [Tilletia horrida]